MSQHQRKSPESTTSTQHNTGDLANNPAFFAAVVDTADALITVLDRAGNIVLFNHACETLTGYTPAEVTGQPFTSLFLLPEEAASVQAIFTDLKAGHFPNRHENHWKTRSGEARLITWSNTCLVDEHGEVEWIIGTGIDITTEQELREQQRHTQRRYEALLNQTNDAVLITTLDARILETNHFAAAMLGIPHEELIGQVFQSLVAPEALDESLQALEVLQRGEILPIYERTLLRRDGSRLLVEINASVVRDASGEPECFQVTLRDISARKQAEMRLKESEQHYAVLASMSPVGIFLTNTQREFVFINEMFQQITGLTQAGASGDGWLERVHPEDRAAVIEVREAARAGSAEFTVECRFQRPDGLTTWVLLKAIPLWSESGEFEGSLGVLDDITAQKETDARIRESQKQLSDAEKVAHIGSWRWDVATSVFNWSDEMYRIYSVNLHERPITFERYMECVHPEDQDLVGTILHQALIDPAPLYFRHRAVTANGAVRHIHMLGQATLSEAYEITGILGTAQDITERVQMERALAESEERYRHLVENASDIVYTADPEGHFIYVNTAAARLTGYSEEELLKMRFTELVHPDHVQDVLEFYVQQMGSGVKDTLREFPIVTRDGDQKWVEQNVTLISDGATIRGFESFVRDVTERKLAQAAEQEQRILAEALAETSAVLNSSLDLNQVLEQILNNLGRVVPHDMANLMLIDAGMAQIVRARGYEDWGAELAIGLQMPLETSPKFRQMFETGRSVVVADTHLDPDWVVDQAHGWQRSYAGAPIHLDGEVIGFLNLDSMFANAFTEKDSANLEAFANQAALAIKNAQLFAELNTRNAELDAFSHTVAHDLKAPLQIIIGYVTLLKAELRDTIDAETLEMIATVSARAFQMAKIIDSLLLFSTLKDASQQISPIQIAPIVKNALARFEDRIKERHFKIEVADEFPPALGYGPWVEEVFANLISNAVKYIGKDNAAPRIAIRGIRDGQMVRFEIEDNGLGIKPEDQKRLFEMFSRFHSGEEQGFGLGMSIIQRIVMKLGGTIGVTSEPGVGSTFWFTLPAVPETDA